jgi:hypothetical protein
MTRWPITLLLTCAVGLGLYLGYLYLKKTRRPGLVGLHLLLGAGSVEGLVAVLHGSSEAAYRAATPALIAACLFGYSLFSGFTGPLFGQHSRRTGEAILISHATAGLAGFLLFLVWITRH